MQIDIKNQGDPFRPDKQGELGTIIEYRGAIDAVKL